MHKTILYRIFKLGRVPKRHLPTIEQEGIVLMDEGIRGSAILRNFRAPGKRYSLKRTWFSGSIVMTRKHFLAFSFYRSIIGVPWTDQRLAALNCSINDGDILCVRFDAAVFHNDWSGSVEYRFKTPKAQVFLNYIRQQLAQQI